MQGKYLTVVMPLFNQSRHLKKSLRSLLDQHGVDFEVIVVDDASTDDSARDAATMLRALEPERVQFMLQNERRGLWEARKSAINAARGKYLLFLDPREWLEPSILKRLIDTMDSYATDLVQMKRKRMAGQMAFKAPDHPRARYWQLLAGDELRELSAFVGLDSPFTPFCGDKLYRTDLLREAARIDFHGNWGEVQILNIHYLRSARSAVMVDFPGVNIDWTDNYTNFRYSRVADYKNLHTLKRCLCTDTGAVDRELATQMRYHVRQLLGELAWSPEAVAYFLGPELRKPVWASVGLPSDINDLIAEQQKALRSSRFHAFMKRLFR